MLPRPGFPAHDERDISQSQQPGWISDEESSPIDRSGGVGTHERGPKRYFRSEMDEEGSDEGSGGNDSEEVQFPDRVDLKWYMDQYGIPEKDQVTLARNFANYTSRQFKAPRRLNPE